MLRIQTEDKVFQKVNIFLILFLLEINFWHRNSETVSILAPSLSATLYTVTVPIYLRAAKSQSLEKLIGQGKEIQREKSSKIRQK